MSRALDLIHWIGYLSTTIVILSAFVVAGGGSVTLGPADFDLDGREDTIMKVYNWENGHPELLKLYIDSPHGDVVCSSDAVTAEGNLSVIRYGCHEDNWARSEYWYMSELFQEDSGGEK